MKTLFVNFFGGPGTGKSTTSALAFGALKADGVNAELITEFAKDLTWEQRTRTLACQPYVFGKQLWKMERLEGQVDVALSDSPLLLCAHYGKSYGYNFYQTVHDTHKRFECLNIFLERDTNAHAYNPKGRSQTVSEAVEVDQAVKQLLIDLEVPHYTVIIRPNMKHVDYVVRLIENAIGELRAEEAVLPPALEADPKMFATVTMADGSRFVMPVDKTYDSFEEAVSCVR